MKLTKIRNQDGSKLHGSDMAALAQHIQHAIERMGFISSVRVENGGINISNHGNSFVIDVNKLGYNARVNDYTIKACKAGYKRTNTPTWTQREEFNHAVNNVLDAGKYRANIKSGDFIVRSYDAGRVNQWAMPEVYNNGFRLQVPSTLEIVPIKYADDATQWIGINAPFIGAVPEQKPRGLRRGRAKLRLVA